jgi:hypothetical protein
LFNIKARELARKSVPKAKVYCFRTRAALFGHNAPQFEVLPAEIQGSPIQPWKWYNDLDMDIQHYPKENCATIKKIYLDNIYSNILPNSWIVLLSNDFGSKACFISDVTDISLADFLINAKITALMIKEDNTTIPAYKLRNTTVFVESEELELTDEVPLPLDDSSSLNENSIILDHVIDGLNIGQPVSITGELQGISQINNEIAIIKSIDIVTDNDNSSYTKLTFEEKLKHNYKQYTVSLNANVADATHGETKNDILGSGDLSQRQQQFILKEIPLTFVSAPTTKGSKSTLAIRINNILWKEASYLYNLRSNDHAYILRLDNDGTPHITFGDGIHGAKPPSAIENIEAEYRVGIGKDGMLGKDQLTLLMNKPLGVKSVTNPIEPTGAEDPENLGNARQNAPLTILTMERLVSPLDFENFALGFGGIGKAQALVLWNGEKKRIIHLTVGSVFGDPVKSNSDLYKNLKKAIDTHKDQSIPYQLSTFTKKLFNVKANVVVASDRMTEDMISKIEMSLRHTFSYFSRNFGQSVMKSEVIVAIQQVEGVIMVDVDQLFDSTTLTLDNNTEAISNLKREEKLVESIPSSLAHWESKDNKFSKSELLIIHPDSGDNAIKINVIIQGEDRL